VISPPTLADLMANPGEFDISCLDCHHNTIIPVAALLSRYAAETPFPEVWGRFRCSACEVCGRSALLGGPPGGRADNPTIATVPGSSPAALAPHEGSPRPVERGEGEQFN
jgi:ribosomal protein S27E